MIFFETAGQARGFLLLLAAGLLAGAAYDLLGLAGRLLPRWARPLMDGLWCLLAAADCTLALALGGERRVRLYALLGLACGWLLYAWGVRAALRGLARLPGRLRKTEPK